VSQFFDDEPHERYALTLVVIPETREAESSGIYFLDRRHVDPGQLASLAPGMTQRFVR
jgi:hypothetical protein